MDRSITPSLQERFARTHVVEQIDQGARNTHDEALLKSRPETDKWLLLSEHRPDTMHWLFMKPRLENVKH